MVSTVVFASLGTTFDMLCAIEQEASSLVEVLLAKNVLPPKATLPSITRENTRYLIKQQEQLVTVELCSMETSTDSYSRLI